MKERLIYRLLVFMLIFSFIPIKLNAQEISYNLEPNTIQDLKGKDEIVKNLEEIKRIRNQMYTIDMNSLTAKNKSAELEKQINFYRNELNSVKNDIDVFKKTYSNSYEDTLLAEQMSFIVYSFDLTLAEQFNLLQRLKTGDIDASKLFFSDYLTHIYFYLNLGDQMLAYIDTYYINKLK